MNLISINDLTREQIDELTSGICPRMGYEASAILLFAEPSTRTRVSFELALKYHGIYPIFLDPVASSLSKGETLLDTFTTLAEYEPSFLIIRHKNGTACQLAESIFDPSTRIINAGTGTTNHPTQALGDVLVIKEHFATNGGVSPRIAIVGDIVHSRVASSLIQIGNKMDWQLALFGPPEFTPSHGMGDDIPVYHDLDNLGWADFVYVLRPQLERFEPDLFNKDNYISNWRIEEHHIGRAQYVMHAGPANRGLEITSRVLEGSNSLVNDQVEACYRVRRALLSWLIKEELDGEVHA